MSNKKGQVTLFIILGIIVLIIVGVTVFLININKNKVPEKIYETNYDAKLAPIYNDVVFCTNLLGKEAIMQIGSTGGYIDIDSAKYSYNNYFAYKNNALELFPDSGVIMPYWLHIKEDPDCKSCTIAQNYPRIEDIQSSIELYVEKNMISCLNNFSAYSDLDIMYNSSPVCNVELRDENVFIGVEWPLSVKFADETQSSSLSLFSTILDVRLKKIYEYALNILYQTEMIEESTAFEYFTKDILSFYSFGGQDAPIPPMSGPVVFQFSAPTIWLQQDVEELVKNAVAETIPYMQVVGTKDSFIMQTNNSIKSNFYSNFQNVVYYDTSFSRDIRVRFDYFPMWPMYVNVGPNDGPVIMPESSTINLWLVKLSTTRYRFYYDVSYPVLVTLEDDSAFDGEGFSFNYAYEVNLRDNDPYTNNTISIEAYYDDVQTSEDLGYSQRTVPVLLNVINGYTNMPIEGVTITYKCIDKEYVVGTSKKDVNVPNTYIKSYLAPCVEGSFTVSSPDFAESRIHRDIVLGEPLTMDYIVYPAKNITILLRKRMFAPTVADAPTSEDPTVDRQWMLSSGSDAYVSSTDTDEEIILLLSEVKSDGGAGRTYYLNSKDKDNVITIAPGEYSINVIDLLRLGDGYQRQNITIPGRTTEVGTILKKEEIKISETVLENSLYVGGITIDDSTIGNFRITSGDLMIKSDLVVYFPSFSPDELKYVEDLNVLEKILDAPNKTPQYFTPVME